MKPEGAEKMKLVKNYFSTSGQWEVELERNKRSSQVTREVKLNPLRLIFTFKHN